MKKIAIACQGGGSHTAFTAGVLISLLKNRVHTENQVVGLSGTSGGAICATLAWEDILRGSHFPGEKLEAFWKDNATESPLEWWFNQAAMALTRLSDHNMLPEFKLSPYHYGLQWARELSRAFMPWTQEFCDFEGLLNRHIDFEQLDVLKKSLGLKAPALLIGAADVLTGRFRIFNSRDEKIAIKMLLASAAIPSLFKAVDYQGHSYWDGLFSDNPPVDELIHHKSIGKGNAPKELWVIQVNPDTCTRLPTTYEQIEDRRNEMIGNLSLMQNLKHVRRVNNWIQNKNKATAFAPGYVGNLQHVDIFIITMSDGFQIKNQDRLRSSSKLNRDALFLKELIEHGKTQGEAFIKSPGSMKYPR